MSSTILSASSSPATTGGNAGTSSSGRDDLRSRVQSLRLDSSVTARGSGSRVAWFVAVAFAVATFGLVIDRIQHPAGTGEQATNSPDAKTPAGKSTASSTAPTTAKANSGNAGTASTSSSASSGPVALESKGYIIPEQKILVSPKVSGMVIELNLIEGQRVEQGDVLAVLESIDYELDVRRAEATLAVAQQRAKELEKPFRDEEIQQAAAEVQEAEAQLEQFKAEYNRAVTLKKTQTITPTDFGVAESSYLRQIQRVAKLKAGLALAQMPARKERIELAVAEAAQAAADLDKAKWRLGNCSIVAPISGTILRKNAEKGNIVNPIAFNGSYSVCELADLSKLEVELYIQERDLAAVKVGQACRIRSQAFPDREYNGTVSRLMPIADRAKGAVPVRVKLMIPKEEEGVYLKPEMSATVSFLNETAGTTANESPRVSMGSATPAQ